MNYLTTREELEAHPDYLVFDCRFALTDKEIGRRQFLEAHIPGAQYADLDQHLSGAPGDGGRHPLPDPAAFLAQVRQWGIGNDDHVVCYDANNGAFAARLWWMLRWLGHGAVTVLNGGFDAWTSAGLTTDQAIVRGAISTKKGM